jgi:hypothetical protein
MSTTTKEKAAGTFAGGVERVGLAQPPKRRTRQDRTR